MTENEVRVLAEFLTGGLLVGAIGSWLDRVVGHIQGRE